VILYSVALASSSNISVIGVAPDLVTSLDNVIRDDLQSFSHSFFVGVLVSAFIVAIGVALEGPELLHEMWPRLFTCFTGEETPRLRKFKRTVKKIGFWGWLLIAVGVAGEGIFEALQNRTEGQLQTFNEILITDAQSSAGNAKDSAEAASSAAFRANDEADEAQTASSNASVLARGARKEADSFEKDILLAKTQAAKAESDLAEAQREAAQAEEELKRIRSPRSLINVPALIAALKPRKGTEYALNVFQDDESIRFTRVVDTILGQAGWIRKQPGVLKLGITSMNVFSQDIKDAVPVCIETGLQIHAQSTESLQALQSRPVQYLPETIQAAIALRAALASSVSPSDERNVGDQVSLDTTPGEGPVLICVGRKP